VYKIQSPESDQDYLDYYELRWRILRAPWGQVRGAEKDEFEDLSHHVCVKTDSDEIIGAGRLHTVQPGIAQIRYMAIDEDFRQTGIGRKIYQYLEDIARKSNIKKIFVDARINAVGFYEQMGFIITGDGHTLFDDIQHKIMEKKIISIE
jgi:N-acetylglutamate synthase-like GNAT family acetyltransferase